jgi:hypothetical protein
MRLRKLIIRSLSIISGIVGVAIIGGAYYWSIVIYKDISQFLAFLGIGAGCVIAGVTLTWLEQVFSELDKIRIMQQELEDFIVPEHPLHPKIATPTLPMRRKNDVKKMKSIIETEEIDYRKLLKQIK